MARLNSWRFVVCLSLMTVPAVFALPKYRLMAIRQFHYDREQPLWVYDRRVMGCSYCHEHEQGGAPWNPFGQALKAQFAREAAQGQNNKFPQVLYNLLQAEKDSDDDGYIDVLEVFAKTLPGDVKSKPESSVNELRRAFEVAGGLTKYSGKK